MSEIVDGYFYFGYGLNTNSASMMRRCPRARVVGHAVLNAHKFRFAGHADVVNRIGHQTHGVLWKISSECLDSLDRFEGYPYYYERKVVSVVCDGIVYDALMYYMTSGKKESLPYVDYWDALIEGYDEHGVPNDQMYRAVDDVKKSLTKKWIDVTV